MFAILSAAVVLASADPLPADPAAPASPVAAAASPAPKPAEAKVKVVCQDQMPTGTRFPKRQCVEVGAYQRQQENDRRAFEETQNRPMFEIRKGN